MNSRLSSLSTPFLLVPFSFLLVFIKFPPYCSSLDLFSSCSNRLSCGNITGVEYPFWGDGRSEPCGYPHLYLHCNQSQASIAIDCVVYNVLKMDQINNHTLDIARIDFLHGLCSPKFPSTYFDSGQYEFAPDSAEITIHYDCPPPDPALKGIFSCPAGSAFRNGFIQVVPETNMGCKSSLKVGVRRSYFGDIGDLSAMEKAMREGFGVKYKVDTVLCSECTKSGGICGYNSTSKQPICYCSDGSSGQRPCPPPSPPTAQKEKWNHVKVAEESSSKRNLVIGISAAVVGLLLIFGIILCIYKRECPSSKEDNRENFDVEAFIRDYTSFAPKRYSYSHVKKMTNSFAQVIGKGGYGCVYKGTLPDGRHVAVKVLNDSKSNGEDFMNEVASIGRTSHVNIVTLLAFCYERKKRALIYDLMPNGSLDKFIFNQEYENATRCLDWKTLYEIALGIARGLEYLHRGCNTRILHFDIKPQNILLDKDFVPKISDFGLAKLWLNKESIVSMMGARGTAGYIAPEVFSRNFGGVSHKSDVYSYGMLVLEMVGGRRNIDLRVSHTSEIYFPHWIYEDVELDKDLRVLGVTTEEEKETARKMLLVSFWCIQTNPSDRPPMSKVVDMLEGNLQQVQIPPKPFLFPPARSPHQSTESS